MSRPPFRVRLRLPSSKQETLTLSHPVTIRALLEGIQPFVDADLTQIGLRLAYPPKEIDLGGPADWDRDVKKIGINNGEGLVVRVTTEQKSTESDTQQQAPADPSTTHEPISVQPVKPKITNFQNLFVESKDEGHESPVKSAPPARRNRGPSVQEEPPEIPVEGGSVVLRVMEDDNSCLFNAIIYCVGKGAFQARDLRQIITTKIREDPVKFDAATLGKSVNDYCAWITRNNSWGGEIELAILTEYFEIGIDCVDVKTGHVFSYGESYPTRCILIYSGIHYDALAYTFIPSMPEADVTIYQILPPGEPTYSSILLGARSIAKALKERGYDVDTATFNIVCEQCGKGFIGEKEAIKHAEVTGHTAFGQIPPEEDG